MTKLWLALTAALILAACTQNATPTRAPEPGTAEPGGLPAPADLTLTTTDRTVTVDWTPVDSAVRYRIWRDGEFVAEVADPPYADEVSQSGVYGYQVEAVGSPERRNELQPPVFVEVRTTDPR